VSGPREGLARFGGAARVIGTVGGDSLSIEGVLDVPLAELSRAHAGGLADLLH
jgi:phosphoribosylformylglycinamidine synthase subunit PurL